ncbi:bifunctional hydroxymethylpyrimidine kinase/phosphomethylpyrimidine kinase [Allorhodopirellula solitaria]|uniref:hydroxymethylpyrimidine kinase n=1 Tax=Allorhodopirellula solitaria TaxID=2527987 RepID=A0A5C5WY48_9BACT|nr:bifunctional hydroxymethylpyrimidine kinase/phosphomethylpyrimidine kinase [Allorhodopirellula solitaria]TWT55894.1 Hydroxymethylpyrimidine/phosphomethylpyrimidine kinase [Allorhodopirellula solitaria]
MSANPDRAVTIAPNAIALTIAGSDPSGGAGLQADLKAFHQNGVYGMSVVTLITVQNTLGVQRLELLATDLIGEQFDAVMSDIPPRVIKTGALGNAAIIAEVAGKIAGADIPVVVDPVMISKHGVKLIDDAAIDAYRETLLPRATLITPNRFEAERLLDREIGGDLDDLLRATEDLRGLGPAMVLLKAGHVDGEQMHVFIDSESLVTFAVEHHDTIQTHGAGCSLSATIAARLALAAPDQAIEVSTREAVEFGIAAVNHAIRFAPEYGKGSGPVESRMLHIGD